MERERWQQVEQLYHAALTRAPAERAAFLAAACAGDSGLRREVEELLRYDGAAESFIEENALALEARQLEAADLSTTKAQADAGQQIGAYQILALLGRGGMGEVHLALDPRLGRKVALKLLPAEFTHDRERVRRFEQEARAASALNHPNIITIHEIGAVEQTHYIVTEYVEGETLRQRMASAPQKRLKASEAIELAAQIAAALAAAHAAGITHRDIKPENVMVRRDGLVKVLDFGLAKLIEPQAPVVDTQAPTAARASTEAGVVLGTPRYMSPEQARGERVDARTDIFSLGVLLYELLAGRAPFTGATASECLAAILRDEPPELRETNSQVPPPLERIVRHCLEKERERRYQSAQELRDDLKNLQRESASTLAPAAGLKSGGKPYQRSALLAVVLLLLAGISVAYFVLRPPLPPKVTGSTTLLSDGHRRAIDNNGSFFTALVTDGARLYFSELVGVQYLLAQVPCTGGEAIIMPTPFRNTFVEDISPNKAELLVSSREAEEMEKPLWILPVLGGSPRRLGDVLAHGATWSPDGKEIVYAYGSALFRMKSDGAESRQFVTVPGPLTLAALVARRKPFAVYRFFPGSAESYTLGGVGGREQRAPLVTWLE